MFALTRRTTSSMPAFFQGQRPEPYSLLRAKGSDIVQPGGSQRARSADRGEQWCSANWRLYLTTIHRVAFLGKFGTGRLRASVAGTPAFGSISGSAVKPFDSIHCSSGFRFRRVSSCCSHAHLKGPSPCTPESSMNEAPPSVRVSVIRSRRRCTAAGPTHSEICLARGSRLRKAARSDGGARQDRACGGVRSEREPWTASSRSRLRRRALPRVAGEIDPLPLVPLNDDGRVANVAGKEFGPRFGTSLSKGLELVVHSRLSRSRLANGTGPGQRSEPSVRQPLARAGIVLKPAKPLKMRAARGIRGRRTPISRAFAPPLPSCPLDWAISSSRAEALVPWAVWSRAALIGAIWEKNSTSRRSNCSASTSRAILCLAVRTAQRWLLPCGKYSNRESLISGKTYVSRPSTIISTGTRPACRASSSSTTRNGNAGGIG